MTTASLPLPPLTGRCSVGAPDVSIVIPTYKEAANLRVLVPRLAEVMAAASLEWEAIVVDDNSPDDTIEVCRALAEHFPLRLEVRTAERGLSSAVVHGLNRSQGQFLLVMDADLSHPPEKIPELIDALRSTDADFVIGSRYVAGGGTDDDWGLFRWLNSQAATLLARPFTSARDPMAGFFALRRTTYLAAEDLNPIGYKIGLELIVKCRCRRIVEVPIQFANRLYGESKLTVREQLNYLRHLGRLGLYKLGRFARPFQFALVGLSGALVDLSVYLTLLAPLGMDAARGLAIWLAMSWNWYWNRRFTFRSAGEPGAWAQYARFCAACLAGGALNWSVSVGLCRQFAWFAEHPAAAAVAGIVSGFAFNYLASSRWAFGRVRRGR